MPYFIRFFRDPFWTSRGPLGGPWGAPWWFHRCTKISNIIEVFEYCGPIGGVCNGSTVGLPQDCPDGTDVSFIVLQNGQCNLSLFQNSSPNYVPGTLLWDFGDGSTSTEQSPLHTYTAEGLYTVTLTATGSDGDDTVVCLDCINVFAPAPVAAFDLDPSNGTYDLTVYFTDLSSGPIDAWLWDFGDGITSAEQNPSHIYSEEGLYSITLQVEGPGGSDTLICDSCVTVTAPPPVAAFDADPTSGINDLTVQFSDSSTGPILSWLWDFGDGNTSVDVKIATPLGHMKLSHVESYLALQASTETPRGRFNYYYPNYCYY